ncbi:MAG: hypothetical protein K1W24_01565, partial [Lachnospiraceae bacterium]
CIAKIKNRRTYGVSPLMLSTLVLSNGNRLLAFARGSPCLFRQGRMSQNGGIKWILMHGLKE